MISVKCHYFLHRSLKRIYHQYIELLPCFTPLKCRFLRKKIGTSFYLTEWKRQVTGHPSTSWLSWLLATMYSLTCSLPFWSRGSLLRWVQYSMLLHLLEIACLSKATYNIIVANNCRINNYWVACKTLTSDSLFVYPPICKGSIVILLCQCRK